MIQPTIERNSQTGGVPDFQPLRIVVALGGNAVQPPYTTGTSERLLHNIEQVCRHLVPIIASGHRLVVTHGNGSQVSESLLALEQRAGVCMDVNVAMTQGRSASSRSRP